MKKILLAIVPAAFLASCTPPASEEPAAPAAAPDATANQYGVPGGNLPSYDPNAAAYQPIPPINPVAPAPTLPTTPAANPVAPPPPVAAASSHVVAPGDSLWALARKHKVTVEALQQANGMTDTQINVGQTIKIPAVQ